MGLVCCLKYFFREKKKKKKERTCFLTSLRRNTYLVCVAFSYVMTEFRPKLHNLHVECTLLKKKKYII